MFLLFLGNARDGCLDLGITLVALNFGLGVYFA